MCIVGIGCASAYEVGQDVTSQLQTSWTNGGNNYDGGVERYLGSGFGTGKIIYMTTNAVESAGCYEVEFYAIANMAGWDGAKATGNGIAQAYIGDNAKYDLTVYSQNRCTVVKEANLVKGTINVAAGGTIELGIQNLKDGGTWYVCKLKSITYKGTPSASNPVDVTVNYLKNPSFEIGSIDGWTNSGTVALGSLNTSPANNPKVGDYFVEKWGASGSVDFYQTTSTLPAGKYRIGVRARNEASAKAYLYAGSSHKQNLRKTAQLSTQLKLN